MSHAARPALPPHTKFFMDEKGNVYSKSPTSSLAQCYLVDVDYAWGSLGEAWTCDDLLSANSRVITRKQAVQLIGHNFKKGAK